jgi:hypothetical protein
MAAPSGGGGGGLVGFAQGATGTGKSLNYVGNHVFAYSGIITSVSSTAPLLDFTTGGEYIDAIVLFQLASEPASGVTFWFDIEMDGQVVNRQILMEPYQGRQPSDSDNLHMIIPPFTRVTCTGYAGAGDEQFCVIIKGRLYA